MKKILFWAICALTITACSQQNEPVKKNCALYGKWSAEYKAGIYGEKIVYSYTFSENKYVYETTCTDGANSHSTYIMGYYDYDGDQLRLYDRTINGQLCHDEQVYQTMICNNVLYVIVPSVNSNNATVFEYYNDATHESL